MTYVPRLRYHKIVSQRLHTLVAASVDWLLSSRLRILVRRSLEHWKYLSLLLEYIHQIESNVSSSGIYFYIYCANYCSLFVPGRSTSWYKNWTIIRTVNGIYFYIYCVNYCSVFVPGRSTSWYKNWTIIPTVNVHVLVQKLNSSVFVPGRSTSWYKNWTIIRTVNVHVLVQKLNNNSHSKCKSKSPKTTRLQNRYDMFKSKR